MYVFICIFIVCDVYVLSMHACVNVCACVVCVCVGVYYMCVCVYMYFVCLWADILTGMLTCTGMCRDQRLLLGHFPPLRICIILWGAWGPPFRLDRLPFFHPPLPHC